MGLAGAGPEPALAQPFRSERPRARAWLRASWPLALATPWASPPRCCWRSSQGFSQLRQGRVANQRRREPQARSVSVSSAPHALCASSCIPSLPALPRLYKLLSVSPHVPLRVAARSILSRVTCHLIPCPTPFRHALLVHRCLFSRVGTAMFPTESRVCALYPLVSVRSSLPCGPCDLPCVPSLRVFNVCCQFCGPGNIQMSSPGYSLLCAEDNS